MQRAGAQQYRPSARRYTDTPCRPYPRHDEPRAKRHGVISWRIGVCYVGEALQCLILGFSEGVDAHVAAGDGHHPRTCCERFSRTRCGSTHRSDLQHAILALMEEFAPESLVLAVRRS